MTDTPAVTMDLQTARDAYCYASDRRDEALRAIAGDRPTPRKRAALVSRAEEADTTARSISDAIDAAFAPAERDAA